MKSQIFCSIPLQMAATYGPQELRWEVTCGRAGVKSTDRELIGDNTGLMSVVGVTFQVREDEAVNAGL